MKSRQSDKVTCKAGILTASIRSHELRNKRLVRQITVQRDLSVEGGNF